MPDIEALEALKSFLLHCFSAEPVKGLNIVLIDFFQTLNIELLYFYFYGHYHQQPLKIDNHVMPVSVCVCQQNIL